MTHVVQQLFTLPPGPPGQQSLVMESGSTPPAGVTVVEPRNDATLSQASLSPAVPWLHQLVAQSPEASLAANSNPYQLIASSESQDSTTAAFTAVS